MNAYVNIEKNAQVPKGEGPRNHVWPFESSPTLPLQKCGYLYEIGWDIPMRWALDNSKQWWADNAHGHELKKSNDPPEIGPHNQWTAQKLQKSN